MANALKHALMFLLNKGFAQILYIKAGASSCKQVERQNNNIKLLGRNIHVCCATRQTCLLHHKADMSAARHGRHVC